MELLQRKATQVAIVAVAYYGAAHAGLLLSLPETNVSPVWPATGIALAAVVIVGPWAALGVFIGEIVANTQVFVQNGVMPLAGALAVSASFALGNALEALLGGFLYKRWVGEQAPAQSAHGAFGLARVAMAMSVVSALFGISSLIAGGLLPWTAAPDVAPTWWLGNVSGVALVTPVILGAHCGHPLFSGMQRAERNALVALAALLPMVIYLPVEWFSAAREPLFLLVLVLWAVFRAPPTGATSLMMLVAFPVFAALAAGAALNVDLGDAAAVLQLSGLVAALSFLVVLAVGTINDHRETLRIQDSMTRNLTSQVAKQSSVIEATNQRLRAVFDHAHDAILTVDDKGFIVEANPAARDLLGAPKGLTGRALSACIPGVRLEHMQGDACMEVDLPRPDGDLPVDVAWTTWSIEGRTHHTAFIRDISARRRAEAERQASMRHQAEVEHLKSREHFRTEFINQAAHELRTPLTPLMLQASVLSRVESSLSPAGKRSVAAMERNLKRLKRIVDDLLDIGRYESGHMDLERKELDLRALIEDVAESRRPSMEAAGLELHVALEDVRVLGDDGRIAQMLHNLLSNAEKYTPRGGQVHVRAKRDMGAARIEVQDTGIGIDPKELPRLFEPFKRLPGSEDKPGTGLGLYVCQAIAELHGGELTAHSEGPGKGTTFVLRLPTPEVVLEA